ncbi:glutamine amidotransferase [Labrenzia sp. C1B10]|uniref:type 1 glutamine amidotransferase n=1 Tax=unclassified Labrenzia TaxID=2648686 RepID=UPI0003B85DC1|nr:MULTISPECIES: type 1 glutamine amidotransferase [unclassified Labrenzia]ERP88712.1 glutamine amidotransferase [Labrenzia sp. C1B10]ERP99342.1 glutamine amidotransferase [Labrenzia sp. C1B70]
MHFLVVENYQHTELGILGRVATQKGHSWHTVKAYEGDPLPHTTDAFAGLVVLGGAQDALADEAYPHLPKVCDLIRAFDDAGKPVLGICLGSQLIARAFGGENLLGLPVEFGWHDVTPTDAGLEDPVVGKLGAGAPQFHWHSDTVTLPDGAVLLASSDMTPVQAFRMGDLTYAIQFHFEAGLPEVRNWSEAFSDDIRAHTPDWHSRFDTEASRHAAKADETGATIAKAWLSLL